VISIINYRLKKEVKIFFSKKLSLLFIRGSLGTVYINLPSIYYVKFISSSNFSFSFRNYFFFRSFVRHMLSLYNMTYKFFFIKLKIRGMGYFMRMVMDNICYFFFNRTNFFYLIAPSSLFVQVYRKRIFLVSHN